MTTNQRMELRALLEALRSLDGPVVVHSDSTYVVHCFNDRWYEGWLKRDWRNSQRKPVANRDLWEPLVELYLPRKDEIDFVWVKGHAGDEMNELVDGMAVAESVAQQEALAGSKGPGAAGGPPPPWPPDRAVALTGVRDPDGDQLEGLEDAIDGLDPANDILVSGLRRGVELTGAERAVSGGLPLAVVLPYADPAQLWPSPDRQRFQRCVDAAGWVVTLGGDPARPSAAVADRDRWMWGAVVGAIVVGNPALVGQLDADGLGVIAVD